MVKIRKSRFLFYFSVALFYPSVVIYPIYAYSFVSKLFGIMFPLSLLYLVVLRIQAKTINDVIEVSKIGIKYSRFSDSTILWQHITQLTVKRTVYPKQIPLHHLIVFTTQEIPYSHTLMGKIDTKLNGGLSIADLFHFEGGSGRILSYLEQCKRCFKLRQNDDWDMPLYNPNSKKGYD